ncbi:chromate transporter [Clostridium cadaveris]|uniref:Chromate transporter n=1 Tax=Clostridium cadaveris TaxID=1529 RepID=A0A316M5U8_9CLOT|nr:chromate transporter [Clostridium cadaveris]NWK11220.1 chromate transporter [Clostridium cadaveris]PWL53391.1 MAG: chromate transporter [Clostridium cadaveris]UFH64188.1 chromate transporter [Clostridium cadaveris]
MKQLLELFFTFAKIGTFTFGGGYAMLPMLQEEVVDKHHWTTNDDIMNYFAVAQCTPGIIAVNTATFIGFYQAGIAGAVFATFGIVFPSIVIISIIAGLLQNFATLPVVVHALSGIRVAVCVLVLNAVIKFWKSGVKDSLGIIIFILSLGVAYFTNISTVFIVILSGALGFMAKHISFLKKGSK